MLYNGMASTTPLAALYFVALMTFGNYVLFNLLVAILVEGFQAEVRAKTRPRFCFFPSHLDDEAERMKLIELSCADDTKAAYKRIISTILPVWFLPSRSLSITVFFFLSHLSPLSPFFSIFLSR